ncbi:MAG: hypothetical protein ACM3Y8_13340, partial [Byssovorax cruenta]
MKRIPVLFIAVSLVTASCVGNASLWGQYLTPTPPGGVPSSTSTVAAIVPSVTPTALGPVVTEAVPTLTPLPSPTATSEAFVSVQETTSPIVQNTVAEVTSAPTILYYAQSGDWLPAVAKRFGVELSEIASPKVLPESGLLDPGTLLIIPNRRDSSAQYAPAVQLIPDNEVVFSATSIGF